MLIQWKRIEKLGGLIVSYDGYLGREQVAHISRTYRAGGNKSRMQGNIPEYWLTMKGATLTRFRTARDAKAEAERVIA